MDKLNWKLRHDHWEAVTGHGTYEVGDAGCNMAHVVIPGHGDLKISPFDSGKDVAQAFYDTRPTPTVQEAVSPIADLLPDAVARAEKATLKYPQPNYVISKWSEETGEVTKALIHMAEGRESWENLRDEIVDSLAMLHRIFMEGDAVHGLPALRAIAGDSK